MFSLFAFDKCNGFSQNPFVRRFDSGDVILQAESFCHWEFGIVTNYGWLILSATKLITFDQIKFKNNEKIHIQFVSYGRNRLFL